MRIREFSIIHYGPLPDTGRIHLHSFELFFGKNEFGKTLTIDAILRLLLGRGIKDKYFRGIDRVKENPSGYVVLEDSKGVCVKLPEGGHLEGITGLSPSDCRNIFVIRDSDISIDQEGEFYAEVTDRLTGLRTKDIFRIKEGLRKIGEITPTGMFIDTKQEKLKTRIEQAGDLIGKIEILSKRAQAEGFDRFEDESAKLAEEKADVLHKIEELEDARKRGKHEAGQRAFFRLRECLEKIGDLGIYNQEEAELWRDCESDIRRCTKEKADLLIQLKDKEKELAFVSEELNGKEEELLIFDERKREIDEEIRPQIKNYETKKAEWAGGQKKTRFFGYTCVFSALLLVVSLAGILFRPLAVFYIVGILSVCLAVFSSVFVLRIIREKAWLAESFERINLALSRFRLGADNIEGILSNIRDFGEEYHRKAEESKRLALIEDRLKNDIENTGEIILKLEKGLKDAEDKIAGLKIRSRQGSFRDYAEKLGLKQEYDSSINEHRRVLESLFGLKGKTEEENISYWDTQISALEFYKDKAKGLEYSEEAISKLKESLDLYNTKLEQITKKTFLFKKDLEDVERETNKILLSESDTDYLYCKTGFDLSVLKIKLNAFIMEKEANRDAVLKDIQIFEHIEMEEKGRILELFGKKSPVSEYFHKITGGLYDEARFDQGTEKILVKRKDGVILGADKLSGGAYDQLYLSIRVALGEKLLKGGKGFFIMDDPFLKSDQDRLKRQVRMLWEISESGWQIIYFSSKEEVREALKEYIVKGAVNYVEIENMLQ